MSGPPTQTPEEFDARFQRLADEAGLVPDDLVDPDDDHAEHKRLAVYRLILDRPKFRPLLLSCLAGDPDPLVASDVLVKLLERVESSERQQVVDTVNRWRPVFRSQQEFVQERARELDALDASRTDDPGTPAIRRLLDGTDYLQRRAVEKLISRPVLEALGAHGRTRRVRGHARDKLDMLGRTSNT